MDFIKSVIRLFRQQQQQKSHLDEEQAANGGPVTAPSTTLPSILGDPSEKLALFRLMLGIDAPPNYAFSQDTDPALRNFPFKPRPATRPANNIGLYARVVNSEEEAERNFKIFSKLISSCYFLQIIIAAALTALGAAGANNKAITAFGAINTVIAGFLTFLKGSGLPGRLQYFSDEWKKVRVHIEQREREFSCQNCKLDVLYEVKLIEEMYEKTKQVIEMNTPDSYNSVRPTGDGGNGGASGGANKIGGIDIDVTKIEGVVTKLKNLDGTVRALKASIEKTSHDIHTDAKQTEDDIRRDGKTVMAEFKE